MLCRFELAQAQGLYSTAGFVELDSKTAEQTAELILQRLAINESSRHFFEPCRFDLDRFTEQSMETIMARNGLIGFAISCRSLMLLRHCRDRIKLELGRSNIVVREPFVLDPRFKTAEMGVQEVLRLRNLLEKQDVLLAVQISDAESANFFWSSLRAKFSGEAIQKLVILMALGAGCAVPEGAVEIETPLFGRFHAYRWVREVIATMRWPEELIECWVDSMFVECSVDATELYHEQVYTHLDETTNFIRNTPKEADFRAELKRRETIYVSS
jgi:hypothetical protein